MSQHMDGTEKRRRYFLVVIVRDRIDVCKFVARLGARTLHLNLNGRNPSCACLPDEIAIVGTRRVSALADVLVGASSRAVLM